MSFFSEDAIATLHRMMTSRCTLTCGFLLTVAACGPEHSHAALYTTSTSNDSDVVCVTDPKRSHDVATQPVDLGPAVASNDIQSAVLQGRRTEAVVLDSTDWPRVWRVAVDSAATPRIFFGSDGILFTSTQYHSVGPTHYVIAAVRQCDQTRGIVVATREDFNGKGDSPSRGFAAVRVPLNILRGARVVFVSIEGSGPITFSPPPLRPS